MEVVAAVHNLVVTGKPTKQIDWHSIRRKLEIEARNRKQAERRGPIDQKGLHNRNVAIAKKEHDEEHEITVLVKSVLCGKRDLSKNYEKRRKSVPVANTINNTKKRMLTRFGTDVRRSEIQCIKQALIENEQQMKLKEAAMAKRTIDFENRVQTAAALAQAALKEADTWQRKRTALAQPIIKLIKEVSKLRSENEALKVTLESNQYCKLFIDCVTHNFTNDYGRPSTLESYSRLSSNSLFRPMIEVTDVLGELEDIEDRNLRMIESFQNSQDSLDDTVRHHLMMAKRKDVELKHMKYQKYLLKTQLDRLVERGNELEFFCQTFAEGDNGLGFFDKDELLLTLRHHVRRIYKQHVCLSDIEFNVDTLEMMTAIETRIEDLIDFEETLQPDKVREAQRNLEMLRRKKANEDKELAKKLHQQQRNEKAIERLNQAKAKRGRKLMERSPPKDGLEKKSLHALIEDVNEKLEHEIFFT